MVKASNYDYLKRYFKINPHEPELREIFRLAKIQYGRVDYSILNGTIQVWEINTNFDSLRITRGDKFDQICGLPRDEYWAKKFELAFEEIDSGLSPTTSIPILEFLNPL